MVKSRTRQEDLQVVELIVYSRVGREMRETKERDNEKDICLEHWFAHMQSNLFHDKEYTFVC
jgi:hypothetical protein